MATIGVVGATSWGATLATLLVQNGHGVVIMTRNPEEVVRVRQHGIPRLPELVLSSAITLAVPADRPAVDGWVVAIPTQSVRPTLVSLDLDRETPVMSAAKGLEASTELPVHAVLADLGWPEERIAVLSGPNLAPEIVEGKPAAAVVASRDPGQAAAWQANFNGPRFRVYRSADVVGVSLGGALKNIIAIAAGAAFELGLGTNTVAAVVTRGLAETTRLAVASGASAATFQGLAGVGDLAATCFSPLSRNRRYGAALASGMNDAQAREAVGGVVEGAWTAAVAVRAGRALGVELPIAEQVARAVAGQTTAAAAMLDLLARAPRPEDSWGP